MDANRAGEIGKRHPRRLAIGAGAMLMLSCAVTGGIFHLQRRALSEEDSRAWRMATLNARFETTAAQKAISLERAKELREKWRPWALQHKTQLNAMLSAGPHGQAAAMTVWEAIPAIPGNTAIRATDLVPSADRTSDLGFSWWPIEKARLNPAQTATNSKLQKHKAGMQRLLSHRMRQSFADWRDIVIAGSMNRGRTRVYLWASGRITEMRYRPSQERRGNMSAESAHQELVPPYEFLQPSNKIKRSAI
ncbi:MAG: hypothetical protein JWN98_1086 [Abditibacteriota bacterium]|nr:hypothetical protein [Abditibacteriota bacterium]